MKNISDSEIMKAHPEARARMKADEQIIRDLIQAEKDGTLEETGDVDLYTTLPEEKDI